MKESLEVEKAIEKSMDEATRRYLTSSTELHIGGLILKFEAKFDEIEEALHRLQFKVNEHTDNLNAQHTSIADNSCDIVGLKAGIGAIEGWERKKFEGNA